MYKLYLYCEYICILYYTFIFCFYIKHFDYKSNIY